MTSTFDSRLRAYAKVIVQVGVNLQRGQKLLIADPYELQGVSRSALALVEAVQAASGAETDVIWGDEAQLHDFAGRADWNGFEKLVAANARRMKQHLAERGCFLFLVGSQPRMLTAMGAERTSQLHRIAWQHFGPIVQKLTRSATQWTLAPAPSVEWAEPAFCALPAGTRLDALWQSIFAACRCDVADPIESWRTHLAQLAAYRDTLKQRRIKSLHYRGEGTDLRVALPSSHTWCTASMRSRDGVPFVANLPTEEVFTAPDMNSAEGTVRVARPINYGGAVIDGIELEFRRGRVERTTARQGGDLLGCLLATDEGARRLGEVALVGESLRNVLDQNNARPFSPQQWASHRLYYHTLLDENSSNHVALGESYAFCNRSLFRRSVNRSLIHVDLPLDASVEFSGE
jgi:aminopeptidase